MFRRRNKDEQALQDALKTDDPELLRERQRLLQTSAMDKWSLGMLAEQRRSRRWGIFFRLFLFGIIALSLINTSILIYHASYDSTSGEAHIGVVDVEGVIDSRGEASASRIIRGVRNALDNEHVTSVLLRINSPGGSPSESQRVFEELRHLRAQSDIPIVSWVGDIGASGAYYIAAGTEHIYASPSSLIGSIGVISSSFGFQEAMESLGIERRVFTAGNNKAMLDPFSVMEEEQATFWQQVLEDTHKQFTSDVLKGREGRLNGDTDELFSGLVWTGNQALDNGLIDEVATLDRALRLLADTNDIPLALNYTPKQSPFTQLSGIIPGLSALSSMFNSKGTGTRLEMEF
jgi:protease-4